ncbi:MAG: EamA family transporter [Vicinamibacterales bacterium]
MTPVSSPREKRLAYFAWIAVCLIWGTTYFGIRVTLETMPPFLMSGMRWLIAGGLLLTYLGARGERLPPRSRWGGIVLMGFLLLVIGNGGVAYAEQWVPSGLAAVLVATAPFWMAGVEASLRNGERVTARTFVGLLVGFSGILVLVWPELTRGSADSRRFLIGVVALQVASLGWSLGSSYSRRHGREDHVLGTAALQMIAGGMMLLMAGTLRSEWSHFGFNARTTSALAYLATLGAIGGFVAYTYALRHLPVSFVSLYAYINPVIAVALGVLLLGEPFNARIAGAAALVLVGVAIVRPKTTAAAAKRRTMVPPRRADFREQRDDLVRSRD